MVGKALSLRICYICKMKGSSYLSLDFLQGCKVGTRFNFEYYINLLLCNIRHYIKRRVFNFPSCLLAHYYIPKLIRGYLKLRRPVRRLLSFKSQPVIKIKFFFQNFHLVFPSYHFINLLWLSLQNYQIKGRHSILNSINPI